MLDHVTLDKHNIIISDTKKLCSVCFVSLVSISNFKNHLLFQERDEQISRLKERLTLLSKKLTENKESCKFPRDKSKEQHQRQLLVQEQGVELQSIIRQVSVWLG